MFFPKWKYIDFCKYKDKCACCKNSGNMVKEENKKITGISLHEKATVNFMIFIHTEI